MVKIGKESLCWAIASVLICLISVLGWLTSSFIGMLFEEKEEEDSKDVSMFDEG